MGKIYRISLFLSFALLILGVLCKIQHWPGGNSLMAIALVLALVYLLIALIQIFNSEKSFLEKIVWMLCFVFFAWITGFIYYFVVIKKQNEKIESEN